MREYSTSEFVLALKESGQPVPDSMLIADAGSEPENPELLFRLRQTGQEKELSLAGWTAFSNPESIFTIETLRRRIIREVHRVFCRGGNYASFAQTDHGSILFNTYSSLAEVLRTFLESMQGYRKLPLEKDKLLSLTPQAWSVIGLLCDDLLQTYPHPEPDWVPKSEPVFNLHHLRFLLETENNKPAEQKWSTYWRLLSGVSAPSLTDLEEGVALLLHQRLIGDSGEAENLPEYYLGSDLFWVVRTMAWWDSGIRITTADDPHTKFTVIQAGALWLVIEEEDRMVDLIQIDVDSGSQALEVLLSETASSFELPDQPSFCPACGKKFEPDHRFCRYCGTPL